jgi:hypothetical protein
VTEKNNSGRKPRRYYRRASLLVLATAFIAALITCGALYAQHQHDQRLLKSPEESNQKEARQLVSQISKLMVLPAHEKPTIATVSDANRLPRQVFFKDAQNGDKVLIYTKAKTAILYDPRKNLILAVSQLNIKSDNH